MTEVGPDQRIPIRRALLGVYDKTGIEDLAREVIPRRSPTSLPGTVHQITRSWGG